MMKIPMLENNPYREKVIKILEDHPELLRPIICSAHLAAACQYKRVDEITMLSSTIDFTCFPEQLHYEAVAFLCYLLGIKQIQWTNVKSVYLNNLLQLGPFLRLRNPDIKKFTDLTPEIEAEYNAFYSPGNKTIARHCALFWKKFHEFIEDNLYVSNYYDKDYWHIRDFKLPMARFNAAVNTKYLNFRQIENSWNKKLLKDYILFNLYETDRGTCTIWSFFDHLRLYFVFLGSQDALTVPKETLVEYMQERAARPTKNLSYNVYINSLRDFYAFCNVKKLRTNFPVNFKLYKKKGEEYKEYEPIQPFVLQQVFNKLDKMTPWLAHMFLLIYFTGMRISEACMLQLDALSKSDGKTYVTFYQKKMRKEVRNPIPEKLYQLLLEFRENMLKQYPDNTYFFLNKWGNPVSPNHFMTKMRRFIKAQDIRLESGEPYHFSVHNLRHEFALRMIRHDVPLFTVQNLLHHNSPEMTLAYVVLDEKLRSRRYDEYQKHLGAVAKLMSPEEKLIDEKVVTLRHKIAQILPNGYCGLPVQLGSCPHANACLVCKHFQTGKEYLPILKKQLVRIQNFEKVYPGNREGESWKKFSAMKTRLESLIKDLEFEGSTVGVTSKISS